jgi:hypothetical protein
MYGIFSPPLISHRSIPGQSSIAWDGARERAWEQWEQWERNGVVGTTGARFINEHPMGEA